MDYILTRLNKMDNELTETISFLEKRIVELEKSVKILAEDKEMWCYKCNKVVNPRLYVCHYSKCNKSICRCDCFEYQTEYINGFRNEQLLLFCDRDCFEEWWKNKNADPLYF